MLSATLVLLGAALIALALSDRSVRWMPLTPAVVYLVIGWAAGALGGPLDTPLVIAHARTLQVGVEFALLASLFAIGLRLQLPPTLRAWRVAMLLAGPGMVVTIALGAVVANALLGLPWPAAILVAAVLAPTDPVLASEVQIRSESDRDAVRLSLSAEGGLNDATALPGVALALGLAGTLALGGAGERWLVSAVFWPLAGGAIAGAALGFALGHLLRRRLAAGDALRRDELIYVGAVALTFGIAYALQLSTFIVAFVVGTTLLLPLRAPGLEAAAQSLADRLHAFGGRFERLVEAATVLAAGALLGTLAIGAMELVFALLVLAVVRPLAVLAVVRRRDMPASQRRLVAWFGIRGIGSLYYLLYAIEHGVAGTLAEQLVRVTLICVGLSIVLHGVSATPLMAAYQRRRSAAAARADRGHDGP